VVLADGRVVRAGEREHADLFWGIRGGSGNFGIVTELEFRLHPLGPQVLAGLMAFPAERAPQVLPAWRDWADAAPAEVSTGCAVIIAPPSRSSRPTCTAGRYSSCSCSTSAILPSAPPRSSRSGTSARLWTGSARCRTPPSMPSSTRSPRGADAATRAAST
jgi:hypothetical protein